MTQGFVFDKPNTKRITESRINFLNQLLPKLSNSNDFKVALDAGCGVGYFSRYLADLGLQVVGIDVRPNNISEALQRHPDIKFVTQDVEDSAVKELGVFDLVLCFGLLYHMENPFLAIRNLCALTKSVLIIESMIIPGTLPAALLVDEGRGEDQSLNSIALVLSKSGLIKMLYCAGFSYVYGVNTFPDHEDFRENQASRQKRTILVAAKVPLRLELLRQEPATKDPWCKRWGVQAERLKKFLRNPCGEKMQSVKFRFKSLWNKLLPAIPIPVRLPYGGWWLAVNDFCSDEIFMNRFEKPESFLVERFLKEGMTVLDIGAHHGFYTILASRKVGLSGRVIAFEPSPREHKRLLFHLRLNRCKNVKVESLALSGQQGEAALFVVDGRDTGCNSLRPPVVSEPTRMITVKTIALDDYLEKENVDHVDFMKMDIEGAELEVFKQARRLLGGRSRPVILCEVDDYRTKPWGYSAQAIIELLERYGYRWLGLDKNGNLVPFEQRDSYNVVAIPKEGLAGPLLVR